MANRCKTCGKTFTNKSNLTRHEKIHEPASAWMVKCLVCDKSFSDQSHLNRHASVHKRPNLRMYNAQEARLAASEDAKEYAQSNTKTPIHKVWCVPSSAEHEARKAAGEEWRSKLVITFGKYLGKDFQWLLENDVGWVIWLLHQYQTQGEVNPLLKWQKEQLLQYVRMFQAVNCHLERKMKVNL